MTNKCGNELCETEVDKENAREGWKNKSGEHVQLCGPCGKRYQAGRYCRFCHQIYTNALIKDDEEDTWVECDDCEKYTHAKCITDRDAEASVKAWQKKKVYKCIACRGKAKKSLKTKSVEEFEYTLSKHEVKIELSRALKRWILDDWEAIQKNKVVMLPRTPSVSEILEEYHEQSRKQSAKDVADTLTSLFDMCCPQCLMYPIEEHQLQDYREKGNYSEAFGGEHLLRLFGKEPLMYCIRVRGYHTSMQGYRLSLPSDLFLRFVV
eukprot:GFYU01012811.1.p1 GENE.GFYU01012811.1~~GFYU01012811.1.p1  ORF type:complete len:265 (+),score=44.76 GFYU01012811.1:146-940(+)